MGERGARKECSNLPAGGKPEPAGEVSKSCEPVLSAGAGSALNGARGGCERRRFARRRGKSRQVLLRNVAVGEPSLLCWVIDHSRGGLGLVAPRPLAVGTVLEAVAADAPEGLPPIRIEVRACRPKGKYWRLGCRFTSQHPWSLLLLLG
jgi:hypothetical protein